MPQLELVADYEKISIADALQLPASRFALARRNAVIKKLNQSEEGQKYLADCERYMQTEPDYEKIKKASGYVTE